MGIYPLYEDWTQMTAQDNTPPTAEEILNTRREAVNRAIWAVGMIAGQDQQLRPDKQIDPHYKAAFDSLKSLQQQLEAAAGF